MMLLMGILVLVLLAIVSEAFLLPGSSGPGAVTQRRPWQAPREYIGGSGSSSSSTSRSRTALQMAMDPFVQGKLDSIARTYAELTERLGDPDVIANPTQLMQVNQERMNIEEVVLAYQDWQKAGADMAGAKQLFNEAGQDVELKELARAEVKELEERQADIEERLVVLMLPTDPLDDRNVMLEIRAGTGGSEAGLFAGNLLDIYQRYGVSRGGGSTVGFGLAWLSSARFGTVRCVIRRSVQSTRFFQLPPPAFTLHHPRPRRGGACG